MEVSSTSTVCPMSLHMYLGCCILIQAEPIADEALLLVRVVNEDGLPTLVLLPLSVNRCLRLQGPWWPPSPLLLPNS